MTTGSHDNHRRQSGPNPFKAPVPENCLYVAYLVIPWKTLLVRLSLFGLAQSLPSAKGLFPKGICQEYLKESVQFHGCLRWWTTVAADKDQPKGLKENTGDDSAQVL